jgi:hypothetical protein
MTSYKASVYRSGEWWAIEITDGLPDNMLGVTQAKRLDKTEQAARDVIADLLEVDVDTVEVDMSIDVPVDIEAAIRRLKTATDEAIAAMAAEVAARRAAAKAAIDEGLTMREAGVLLGVSHQRVKQLVDEAA